MPSEQQKFSTISKIDNRNPIQMQTKIFNTVEEANEFITEMSKTDVSLDAYNDGENRYVVNWIENKKYISYDGKEFTDEVWITIDNKMIHVQDLEAEHARNIIRMMLRNRRESMDQAKEMLNQISNAIADMIEEADNTESAPMYLH